jgi:hypothetical protein
MHDRLSALAGEPLPRDPHAQAPVDDTTRILSLPRRPVVVCERDPLTRQYPPATQALIEVMTAQFARPQRVSCACRPRRISALPGGWLSIERILPAGMSPEPPRSVALKQFIADSRGHAAEIEVAQRVAQLRPGEAYDAPSADGSAAGTPCILQLNPVQAWTLREAPLAGGILGFKGVGSGKTISGILAPLCFPDARLAVLMIEPKQRAHYRSHYFRLREHFRVPTIVFDDGTDGQTVPGTPPLHLRSYSVLSQTKNSSMLDDLRPEVVILDEAHRACGDSAINRRVKRYILERIKGRRAALDRGDYVLSRAVFLLDWSGTLENKSAQDTQMLSAYSLGDGSPLPLDPDVAVAYSAIMDVSRTPDRESPLARRLQVAFGGGVAVEDPLVSLISSPERAVRRGFQRWRAETLGVITGAASSINASIYFGEFDPGKMPDVVKEALRVVRDDSKRPDGEILTDRLQQVGCAREVGSGFYNYWAFPGEKCTCTPGEPRCARCLKIDDWFAKRKAYFKEERSVLLRGEKHLDSPKLAQEAAERFWSGYKGDKPTWQCESWPAWRDVENTVQHVEKVRWIGDGTPEAADPNTHPGYYLARAVAKWALKNNGVVWFRSTALGRKIAELSGLPYFNGGPGCEERLRAERGDRSVILSIKALGAGTDGLQLCFSKQLICEMPASNGGNEGAEQLLGRLHREGQRADTIETLAAFHAVEFRDAFRQVCAQAEFNREMLNLKQRILLADLDLEWF